MTTRAEDIAEQALELHKTLAEKILMMQEELHKLCGQVSELRQFALAMVTGISEMREKMAAMKVGTMFLAAAVSFGGGIIAAILTSQVWLASKLDSFFGVRP